MKVTAKRFYIAGSGLAPVIKGQLVSELFEFHDHRVAIDLIEQDLRFLHRSHEANGCRAETCRHPACELVRKERNFIRGLVASVPAEQLARLEAGQ